MTPQTPPTANPRSSATVEVVDEQLGRVAGVLNVYSAGGRTTYRYDRTTPDGPAVPGPVGTQLPPELADAAPDRWGRSLVERLLGSDRLDEHVHLRHMADVARPGSLRFRDAATGAFWGATSEIPPLLRVGDVLEEVRAVAGDPHHRVSELIGMGSSSIGGTRPKATLHDARGRLWQAKFAPGRDDPRREAELLRAAAACGITAAETRSESIGGEGPRSTVLLSRRFDRAPDGARIGMRSMRMVLELHGADPSSADWADLVDLSPEGDDPAELFRRAAFGVLVRNADDHARNHAQLRDPDGVWRLSPAYDVTTDPHPGTPHVLGVYGERTGPRAARALPDLAGHAGVDRTEALAFVRTTAALLAERGLLPDEDLAHAALAAF